MKVENKMTPEEAREQNLTRNEYAALKIAHIETVEEAKEMIIVLKESMGHDFAYAFGQCDGNKLGLLVKKFKLSAWDKTF